MSSFAATYAARPKPVVSTRAPSVTKRTPAVRLSAATDDHESIGHQQSFEIVQTLLLISLASICYLRCLLPESSFEDRDWAAVPENTHWNYDDFVKNVLPLGGGISKGHSAGGKKVKVLAQNGSTAAIKLMSWLDGVFNALKTGVLDKMQLSVIMDKDKPSNIVESYTFSFKYTHRRLDSMVLSSEHGHPVTLKDARSSLATLTRYLMDLTQGLPDLPLTRFLTVHVFYTEDCPLEYIAPGFRPSRDYSVLLPSHDLWRMTEADAGNTNFGFYNVGLKVKHLAPVTDAGIELEEIPSDIEFAESTSRTQNLGQEVDDAGSELVIESAEKTTGHALPYNLRKMRRARSGQGLLPSTQPVLPRDVTQHLLRLNKLSKSYAQSSAQSSAAVNPQTSVEAYDEEDGDGAAEYASTTDGSTEELLPVGVEGETPRKRSTRTSIRGHASLPKVGVPMPPPRPTKKAASKKRPVDAGVEYCQTQRKSARISARSPTGASQ
ncbi:DNA binding protein [Trapelia coarctata]|nr:DNA binding protein [Trapelia coarctata]